MIAEFPDGAHDRSSGGTRILQGKLTLALAMLREKESVHIGDIRRHLDESLVFLEAWISALEWHCAVGANDEKWRTRMLTDWRELGAKIEAARALCDARTAAVQA